MVEAFRAKAGADGIDVVIGDFTATRLERQFDFVLIAFSTLFLLPDQDAQVACLVAASAHLRPGGAVVVEAFVPDHSRWDHGRRLALSRWDEAGVEIEAARHDRANQRIQVRYVLLATDGIKERPLDLRYAWPLRDRPDGSRGRAAAGRPLGGLGRGAVRPDQRRPRLGLSVRRRRLRARVMRRSARDRRI